MNLYQDTETYKCLVFDNRDSWLKGRSNGIGGSSASALINMNPWKDNNTLWKELKRKVEVKDISDKPQVQYGLKAEEFIRGLFALDYPQYEVQYQDNVTLENIKNPWMKYSPDGLLIDKQTGERGILEIKTTEILQSMQREKWNDQIPTNYYIQVLHGLLVTGFDFVVLRAHLKSRWKLPDGSEDIRIQVKDYKFTKKEKESDLVWLLDNETKMWEKYYINDIEPPTDLGGYLS